MTGFLALCQTHPSREESEILCGWAVLVPFSLDEEIWSPIESDDHESMVAGAPQVLTLAEKLAAAIDLPAETQATFDNLDLSTWFRHQAEEPATPRTGSWTKDLDTTFYVALFPRAAQPSVRRGCPIVCT
ncbi:hypothetical protein [Streptomyces cellostaticus]|uniref:hypothetical protein n=1 Tax=Streptomyces TaxID=1883 RepID=UPI0027E33E63|nr:hypothetical protein [Streptomyces cellostaticus]